MPGWLREWLADPQCQGVDLDSPEAVEIHADLIQRKHFLQRIYSEWYQFLAASLPAGDGPVVEIGSGGGFLDEFVRDVVRSDVRNAGRLDLVLDGCQLPFGEGLLRGIVMTNVFHHLPDCGAFLRSAAACVHQGGVLAMVEPWVTPFSSLIYEKLHHEPFLPDATSWRVPTSGPMTSSNQALPWIVLCRDSAKFSRAFPEWSVRAIRYMMPIRYLMSGGVSCRSLAPDWSYEFIRAVEALISPAARWTALFAGIVLSRK